MVLTYFIVFSCILYARVEGHGYLLEPPGRSSMWRPPNNFPVIPNYNDMSLNCGGKWNLAANGGRCGVCGDPYQGPFNNEAGGIYAKGIITRTYTSGQNISVKVKITAAHGGWYEFRLCVNNNVTRRITHDCLNKHLLTIASTGLTRTTLPYGVGVKEVVLNLPENLVCTQCVLQWKWRTANNPDNIEEEFYGCSDIAIRKGRQSLKSIISTAFTQSQHLSYGVPTPTLSKQVPVTRNQFGIFTTSRPIVERCRALKATFDEWCISQCLHNVCPPYLKSFCTCDKKT